MSLPGRYRLQVPTEGIDAFQRWCDLAVDALNHALKGIPEDKIRYHLCWSSSGANESLLQRIAASVGEYIRRSRGQYSRRLLKGHRLRRADFGKTK